MEFSNTHVAALNLKLPAGYIIEQMPLEEPRAKRPEPEKPRAELKFHAPSSTLPPYRTDKDTVVVTPSTPKTPKPEGFRKVYGILQKLKSHPSIGPFLHPVDKQKTPDYYDIIHCPIDLSQVESKLTSEKYASSKEFAADVRKMWSNSFLYNSRGTDIYVATIDLSAYFENLIKGNEDISLRTGPEIILPKIVSQTSTQAESEFSEQKKRQLGSRIKMLHPKFFKGVYDIVKNASGAGEKGDEFEFDIDLLPADVCRRLDEYTSQCLSATLSLTGTQSKSTEPGEPACSASSDSEEEPFSATDNIDDHNEDPDKDDGELWLEQKSTSLGE